MELTSAQEKSLEEQGKLNRTRLFRGTIAITVVYAAIAIFFVVLMFTTQKSKQILGIDLFAFSVTFIAGVTVIVGLLIIQITTYKMPTLEKTFDLYQCPDYWELKTTEPDALRRFPEELRPYLQYYCEPMEHVYNRNTITPTAPTDANLNKALSDLNLYQDNPSYKQSCKRVYPGYMAFKDSKVYPDQPNRLRCDFSKHCNNGSWSYVCQY